MNIFRRQRGRSGAVLDNRIFIQPCRVERRERLSAPRADRSPDADLDVAGQPSTARGAMSSKMGET
jgi:hypothetical protein